MADLLRNFDANAWAAIGQVVAAIRAAAAEITPRRRFHDLRHSAASFLIAQGVELGEISMLLGHAEIRTTIDLYGHLVKQTAKAAGHMDIILKPAAKG